MEIKYQEHTLESVTDYFANNFKPRGDKIVKHEAFVDTAKGVVVFKLFLEPDIESPA